MMASVRTPARGGGEEASFWGSLQRRSSTYARLDCESGGSAGTRCHAAHLASIPIDNMWAIS